jgi:hypothetical protein
MLIAFVGYWQPCSFFASWPAMPSAMDCVLLQELKATYKAAKVNLQQSSQSAEDHQAHLTRLQQRKAELELEHETAAYLALKFSESAEAKKGQLHATAAEILAVEVSICLQLSRLQLKLVCMSITLRRLHGRSRCGYCRVSWATTSYG